MLPHFNALTLEPLIWKPRCPLSVAPTSSLAASAYCCVLLTGSMAYRHGAVLWPSLDPLSASRPRFARGLVGEHACWSSMMTSDTKSWGCCCRAVHSRSPTAVLRSTDTGIPAIGRATGASWSEASAATDSARRRPVCLRLCDAECWCNRRRGSRLCRTAPGSSVAVVSC